MFAEADCNKNLKLSGINGNTITKIGDTSSFETSAYTREWISSDSNAIKQWRITNHRAKLAWSLMIGFINNQHHHDVNKDIDSEGSYLYQSNGNLFKDGSYTQRWCKTKWKEGQTIIFTLDCKCKQITMKNIDDTEITEDQVIFDNIPTGPDIQYKLAIGIYNVDNSMTVSLESDKNEQEQKENDVKLIHLHSMSVILYK